MHTLLYVKWITNKDPLYSTWGSALRYKAAGMAGGLGGRMGTCMRGRVSLLST